MNWLLFILGIPCGIYLILLGGRLADFLKFKGFFSKAIAYVTPLVLFCLLVMILDILF